MQQGLRTCTYCVPDLEQGKTWYSDVFNTQPYYDSASYVGYNIAGFELGLLPKKAGEEEPGIGGATAYWGTDDIQREVQRLLEKGATIRTDIEDVGGDIKMATLLDPFGNVLGIIQNPNFSYSY